MEVIKKLHKDQAQEIKTYKLKLENLQTLKDAAYKVFSSYPPCTEIILYVHTHTHTCKYLCVWSAELPEEEIVVTLIYSVLLFFLFFFLGWGGGGVFGKVASGSVLKC